MYDTREEEELKERIKKRDFQSERDMHVAVVETFRAVIRGTNGINEFGNYVLEKLREIYGDNHSAAAKKGLEIIYAGAERTRDQISTYFRIALIADLQRAKQRNTGLRWAENKLYQLLQEKHTKEYAVKGTIIFSSYQLGRPDGLEAVLLTNGQENTDFKAEAQRKLHVPIAIIGNFSPTDPAIIETIKTKELTFDYRIVTPSKTIKEHIKKELKKNNKSSE